MKRVLSVFLVTLMFVLCPSVAAATHFDFDSAILEWDRIGYPEYITYIYHLNETEWEIGVYNAAQENMDYIKSLCPEGCVVNFKECSLNYSSRRQIANEIMDMKDKRIVLIALMNNSEKILVLVDEKNVDKYTRLLGEKYGEVVSVEKHGLDVAELKDDGIMKALCIICACLAAVGALLAIAFVYYKRKRRLASSNTEN